MRALPHPAADVGNEEFGVGHRLKLKVEDGDPDFYKHNGSYYGIHKNGDFYIDTTHANNGQLLDSTGEWGHEPLPPTDGKGSVVCHLPQDAKWSVKLMDMSDPKNPVPVLIKEMTKDGNVDVYGENYVYEIIIADLSNPENPDPKTTLRLTKDFLELELQDATKRFIVKPDLIELGAENAGDKAVLDSLLQDELDKIAAAIDELKTDFNDHTHPIPKFLAPLIPLSDAPCTPNDDASDDKIVITSTATSSAEYSKGDTNSTLVTIDS
jgi:hypothetical protein